MLLRLLPRHWDGKRLLQFLTGLALLALAFGGPAAAPATATAAAPPAATTAATSTAATTATVRASAAETSTAARAERRTECRHDAGDVKRGAPATHPAAPAGVALGAHGSRAPPRA